MQHDPDSPVVPLASSTEDALDSNAVGGAEGPAQPALGSAGGGKDAPPSNTASDKCMGGEGGFLLPLRWGVDSLYLSYRGEVDPREGSALAKLKKLAQSPDPREVARAQYRFEDHVFQVKDKGAGVFPYVLEDPAFRIQVSKPMSKGLPLAYVKVASGLLATVEASVAEQQARAIVARLGAIQEAARVGRIDLFVDFVSDTDMESWERNAWVTRAENINAYSVGGHFTGWSVGLGSAIAARLYCKTLELKASGKDYLKPLWLAKGWDGQSPVWRLEIQFRREVLSQLKLDDFRSVLGNFGGLWHYALNDWLRLTVPNPADKTRSRWPTHPLWRSLAAIDWGTSGGPLAREFRLDSAPTHEALFQAALRPLVSYMAKTGHRDFDSALKLFTREFIDYHEERAHWSGLRFETYIGQKVELKAREYCTLYNADEIDEEDRKRAEIDAEAAEYRRRSKGD